MPIEPSASAPPLAEIRFHCVEAKMEGVIVKLDTQTIGLRVPDRTPALLKLEEGDAGEVAFAMRGVFHQFQVAFLSYQAGALTLKIEKVLHRPQMRKAPRVEVALHVSWRALRSDGSYSAWCSGLTQDVSLTGMKLLIPAVQETPVEIDALIYLSDESEEGANSELNRLNHIRSAATSEPPVKIRGRVRHSAVLPDSRIALGVLFTRLADVDKVRMRRCLHISQHGKRGLERELANVH